MTIREPITMASDYLLGLLDVWCAHQLFRMSVASKRAGTRLWGAALLSMALASFLGGTIHGLEADLNAGLLEILWLATLLLTGAASALMLAASARATLGGTIRQLVITFAVAKFVVFVWWVSGRPLFRYVIYDYVSAMIIVLLIQAWGAYRRNEPSAPWISAGVIVSFIAAGVQMSEFDLHKYFDHNDLFHVIQMIGVVLFYQGARRIKPR